jgi:non-ribosomal peptide synthetase component F
MRFSYRDLYARATRVAEALRARGVGKGTRVGICLERSWEMLASILGTLQAGAAYVPMDPGYPRDRLSFMAEDAELSALITSRKLSASVLPAVEVPRFLVDDVDWHLPVNHFAESCSACSSDDPAYLIYTSGSTGKPKGVVIEHRNAVAFLCWARSVFRPFRIRDLPASFMRWQSHPGG